MARNYHKLRAFELADMLVIEIYKVTSEFPKDEIYGLTSQLRRAAVSIPTNIAEGCGRETDAELARFCQIATGSASEVEYLLLLSHDLGLIKDPEYEPYNQEVNEVKRMLISFLFKLRPNRNKPQS